MRLIVGLGNPGSRYRETPHNAGFQVCDGFAERHHLGEEVRKFGGVFRRGRVRGEDVGVLKPQTYMNLSGESVSEAVRYLPAEAPDLILVYDEMDLPSGRLRIRPRGGSAGHKGVQSVIDRLGTGDFPRLRVGVGRGDERRGAVAHLLGRTSKRERKRISQTVDLAVEALDFMLECGVEEAMNRYNGLPPLDRQEEKGA